MRILFFISFSFTTAFLQAQTYQSLFGEASTKWHVAWMGIDYLKTDSIYVEKDTTLNGITWKKIRKNTPNNPKFLGGILREDTATGKVWYKSLGTADTSTQLAFNFSLNKGDTFNINNSWRDYTAAESVVDTTYVANGRKIIVFRAAINPQMQMHEKVTFIEGVGSNMGPAYKDRETTVFGPYLLCSYQDGEKIYSNTMFSGNCWLSQTSIHGIINRSEIRVYPSVFTNLVLIENNSSHRFTRVVVMNATGTIVYSASFQNTIELNGLPAGMYYLCLHSPNGAVFTKKIIRR